LSISSIQFSFSFHSITNTLSSVPAIQETLKEKEAREAKMKGLEELAEAGGVKGMRAKAELEAMRSEDELERNKKVRTAERARTARML
jgi:hypothetical protein